MDVEAVVALKLLTDATRLRIVGAVADREQTTVELAAALELPLPVVVRQVGALAAAGILRASERGRGARYALRLDTLGAIGRELDGLERELLGQPAHSSPGSAATDPAVAAAVRAPEDARVLRAFVVDGRLESIPAQERRRRVILRWLRERCFPEDRDYPEKEVNQRIALLHPDAAALRRYLVDSGLMTRSGGIYRRSGAE